MTYCNFWLRRAAWPALLLTGVVQAQPGATAAPQDGRITAITLSSAGMAQVRRTFNVDGNQTLTLQAPLRDVDDWLKSLLVRDPAGTVTGMALEGPEPLAATFRNLPFAPEDLQALPRLAGTLSGVSARASSGGRSVEGIILGVNVIEPEPLGDGRPAAPQAPHLAMLTAPGRIETLRLGSDASLEILDPALRERLQGAVELAGRSRTHDLRQVEIQLEGQGQREVLLDTLVAAPAWKPSYRLITDPQGKARLQGWAVIENTTGEDWQEVELTLASGAPVTYSQSLYEHIWHERTPLEVASGSTAAPRLDDSAERPMMEMAGRGTAGRRMRMASAPMPAPSPAPAPMPSAATQTLQAEEGATTASYRVPGRVSLADGQTLALPFIDAGISGETVWVFQPERGSRHPVAAVMLRNDTPATLPPGILTVYDADGVHAGDAALAAIPPGESRMASFAEDRKVEVTADTQPREDIADVRIAGGVLEATRISRLVTHYTLKGAPDAAREVVIEVPRRAGWTVRSEAVSGETDRHLRLRRQLAAGQQATLELVQERRQAQSVALLDASPEVLLQWSGASADAATTRRLRELAELQRALHAAEQATQQADDDLARAHANQARVRDNLGAVPAESTLGQRYIRMLAEEEDRIAQLERVRQEAQSRAGDLREKLTAAASRAS